MKNAVSCRGTFPLFALLLFLAAPVGAWAAAPDLTKTNLAAIDTTQNYNLGPTGMRGWIYAASPGGYLASQGTTTSWQPWQILVTTVGTNTPAWGIMASNDVILGVSTGAGNLPVPHFTNDSRKSVGWAITAAEAGDGKLNIKRWRAGVTNDVTIQLALTNLAYSTTAPYDCPKSALILSNASAVIGSRSFNAGVPGDQVLGLALLATGNTNHLAKAQAYAYSIAPATLALRFASGQDTSGSGLWVWGHGYKLVFLAEYYLRTGDTNVLHGINEYAVSLAQAQSRYGTMAHGGANLNADGSFHGTVGGYGPVNSGGLVANLGIVLAKKCLVAAGMAVDPEIDPAIGRAAKFFGWYVQKGNIPYGEHEPWMYHAGNGKEYLTALLFAMMGDQPVATEYWARLSLAGYNGQQYGHTGQGFSYVWSGMGVNVGGTNATAAYMAQEQWYLDLERRCDGSFVYDGAEQFGGSAVSDYWTVGGNNDYYGIDPTASWVLTYALPKQRLYLTGRNANPTNWLSTDRVTNAIWAGVYDQLVAGYNTNQLMSALGEYDPLVRGWAAAQLGKLSTAAPLFSTLTNLVATSTNPWVRSAACTALGAMGNSKALPVLVQALHDPDNWVRDQAAKALWPFSAATVSPMLTNIMMAFTNNATDPNVVDWSDPVQIANGALANEIFGYGVNNPTPNNLGSYLASTPTNLYYATVRTGLRIPDSNTRQCGAFYSKNSLPLAGVKAVLPDLMACAAEMTQADTMWCGGCRAAAIQTLGKYYVVEALPLALSMLNVPPGDGSGSFGWNSDSWQAPAMSVLATYGDAARWTLPSLNDYLNMGWGYGVNSSTFAAVQSAIGSIRAATNSPSGMTNLFPVALSQVVNTTNAKAITLAGFSWRTNSVAFTNVTAPAHGTLTGTAPNLTYAPSGGYVGLDSFSFQVLDSFTNSDPATVSLIVGSPAGTGLKGEYYDNANFTNLKFTRTDPQVNFEWGTGSPSNSITADTFSVRWSGLLLAPETGNYRFSTLNSDGVRLYVNGVQVIDDWMDQVRQWTDGTPVYLVAGQQYPIQLDYYESAGDAVAKLKWTGPSFAGTNGALIGQQWLYNGASVTTWPAIAYPQTVTMLQNTNQAILLEGAGGVTNFSIVTTPTHGTLTGTPPPVTYFPATNYSGTDSFTFLVNNGVSNSAPATVAINIMAGQKVSFYWTNTAGGLWSRAANWTNGAPTATGQAYYTLNFNRTGTYSVTNDLNDGFILNQLNVAGTMTFAGSSSPAFTANGPILPQINQNSANTVTFTVPLTLAAMTTLGGTGGGQVTFSSVISGVGGLTINTLAPVKFSNFTNTYSGGTVINGGPVSFPNAGNGSVTPFFGTGPITINSNGELQVNRTSLTNSITLNGGTVSGGNSFQSLFSGPVTLTGITTFDFGTTGGFNISGNVSGTGGLTTVGTTLWHLSGTNSYTGPTTVQDGTLSYDKAAAVGPGELSISDGALVNLNYSGTRTIAALTLGGTNMAPGTYGSSSSTAANKDSHFTGSGIVSVPALLTLSNAPATGITTAGATLNTTLGCGGTNATVWAFWNSINAGTNATLWTNSALVGRWTNVLSTNLTYAVSGLAPNTAYYFSFRATNTAYVAWATNVQSFTTLPLPGPVVDNAAGATNLSPGGAQLRGSLSNGPADVWLYWGTADGGSVPANWANTNLLTTVANGSFSSNVSNLLYGLTYYYRSYASNQWGTAWAAATTNFTTLRPASTLANSPASGIATNAAVLNGTLACTGALYSVAAYWGGTNGGTNPTLWSNSAFVGMWTNVASTNLTLPVSGLAPNIPYYFTFRATNALDSFWAPNVQSFTTLSLPGPVVDNGAGATNLAVGVAQLRGNLAYGPADARLCWGTADGGTNLANWATASLFTGAASGAFSINFSNLLYGLSYYYRCYASNQLGTAWAPATASFTTLRPTGVAAGQIPFSNLVVSASSQLSSGYEATNAFNGNGLLTNGTHNTSGEWASAGARPVSSEWLKVRFDQNYSLDYLRVWAFNEGSDMCVTNASVYVIASDSDPGNNVHLGGGPFNATGWTAVLPNQAFTPNPASGSGPETNTDPHVNLGGVVARQLALKINGTVNSSAGLAGFAEIGIYRLGPTLISLTNRAATSIAATTAGLNGTLACAGAVYDVVACWNTISGGTNAALWTNSAYVGTLTNAASASFGYTATGLTPSTTYYFTLWATNAVDCLWATNVLSFTTSVQTNPPVTVLPLSGVVVSGGVPTFTFGTVAGYTYRLDYKTLLTDPTWLPVIAPPAFPTPDGWSGVSTGAPMSLSDTNAAGQPQRFYRLEAANP